MSARLLLAVVLVVLALAGAAPAGSAQAPTRDSVTGSATDCLELVPGCFHPVFVDLDAQSGPNGENPSGTAVWERQLGTATFIGDEGPVSCLAVTGNSAIIGFSGLPGSIRTLIRVSDGGGAAGQDSFAAVTQLSPLTPIPPPDCSAFPPAPAGDTSLTGSGVNDLGGIVVTDAQPPGRMVGKGSLSGGGKTASYAYIVRCDPAANANAPFEVRVGTQRFRLTSTSSVSCSDDPAVTTPAAGFDTQTGSGTGTLTTGGPATIQWKFVDGGAGGAGDRAQITIKNAANRVVFQGSAAPPAKLPGSTQTTGYNTAQYVPGA